MANITEDSVQISRPYALKPTWNFKAFKNPTASAAGSWWNSWGGQAIIEPNTLFSLCLYLPVHGRSSFRITFNLRLLCLVRSNITKKDYLRQFEVIQRNTEVSWWLTWLVLYVYILLRNIIRDFQLIEKSSRECCVSAPRPAASLALRELLVSSFHLLWTR